MDLTLYVESLREQLITAAEMGGDESRELVDRLTTVLEAATRLVLLEAISAATDEITRELAPGSVEVRLRGSNPEFVVTVPAEAAAEVDAQGAATHMGAIPGAGEDGGTSRLNLRLPDTLKGKIEEAAQREGLSLNAWLVRTAAAAVEGPRGHTSRAPSGSQRFTGWVH